MDPSHSQRSYFPFHDYAYYLDVIKQYKILPHTAPLYNGLKEDFDYYKDHQNEVMRKTSYFEYIKKSEKINVTINSGWSVLTPVYPTTDFYEVFL